MILTLLWFLPIRPSPWSIWNAYWCKEWGRNLALIWYFWVLLVQHVFSLLLARTLSFFSMGHPLIVSEVAYPSTTLDPISDQSGNSIPLATVIGLEKGVSCRLDQSEFLPMMCFYHRDQEKTTFFMLLLLRFYVCLAVGDSLPWRELIREMESKMGTWRYYWNTWI